MIRTLPFSRTLPRPASLLRLELRALPILSVRTSAAPLTWKGALRFPADRIQKGLVEVLMPGACELERNELPSERWVRRVDARSGRDYLWGTIGFRPAAAGEEPEHHPSALKLQWALWARFYAETGGKPDGEARVSLSQLCDDLGYARLANGAHRPATKRLVVDLLRRLGDLELELRYTAPDGSTVHLAGPAWQIEFAPGSSVTVRYRPGSWFGNPVWRRFNSAVGVAPAALLQLRPDRDAWALRVGSYLASLARMNGYRPLTLHVRTLLERTGLSAAESRNPARMREKLERALERLEETGCLGSWDWAGSGSEPDMDSPGDLAQLGAAENWTDLRLMLQWPSVIGVREGALTAARVNRSRYRKRAQRGSRSA
jgi:hypothetical protein